MFWAPSFNSLVVWHCGNCSGNNSNGKFIQCLYPLALGTLIIIIIMIIIKGISIALADHMRLGCRVLYDNTSN